MNMSPDTKHFRRLQIELVDDLSSGSRLQLIGLVLETKVLVLQYSNNETSVTIGER